MRNTRTRNIIIAVALILVTMLVISLICIANGVFGNEVNIFKRRNPDNIIDPEKYLIADDIQSGVTVKISEDGSVALSGTAESDVTFDLCTFTVKATGEDGKVVNYMLSGSPEGTTDTYYINLKSDDVNQVVTKDSKSVNVKSGETDVIYTVQIVVKSGANLDGVTLYPLFVEGVEAGNFYS